jgi:hypothetical protein
MGTAEFLASSKFGRAYLTGVFFAMMISALLCGMKMFQLIALIYNYQASPRFEESEINKEILRLRFIDCASEGSINDDPLTTCLLTISRLQEDFIDRCLHNSFQALQQGRFKEFDNEFRSTFDRVEALKHFRYFSCPKVRRNLIHECLIYGQILRKQNPELEVMLLSDLEKEIRRVHHGRLFCELADDENYSGSDGNILAEQLLYALIAEAKQYERAVGIATELITDIPQQHATTRAQARLVLEDAASLYDENQKELLKPLADPLKKYFRNEDDILAELAAKSEWSLKWMSNQDTEVEKFWLYARYVQCEELLISVHEPPTELRLRHLRQICEIVDRAPASFFAGPDGEINSMIYNTLKSRLKFLMDNKGATRYGSGVSTAIQS